MVASRAADTVAAELYKRNYSRLFRMLRREFPQLPEDLCHDAIVDALEEIRRRGRYRRYSPVAEGDLVKRSRRRAIDRVRRESCRRAIAPTVELRENLIADRDELSATLEDIAGAARLRELVLPLRQEEAEFLRLTALQGMTRDEAAARMRIAKSRARRLVTTTHKRLVAYYSSVADGTVHVEFEQRLRMLLENGSAAEALRDSALATHLQWCERCSEMLRLGLLADQPTLHQRSSQPRRGLQSRPG